MSGEVLLADARASSTRPVEGVWMVGAGATARAVAADCHFTGSSDSLDADATPYSNRLVFVPEFPKPRASRDWTAHTLELDVTTRLTDLVIGFQTAVKRMLEHHSGGRIVLVVPAEHALGQAGDAAAGALAGGIISMCRTLAMELKRKSIAVNVVFADIDGDVPAALKPQLDLLLSLDSWMTGQEIWVGAGLEMGRNRP